MFTFIRILLKFSYKSDFDHMIRWFTSQIWYHNFLFRKFIRFPDFPGFSGFNFFFHFIFRFRIFMILPVFPLIFRYFSESLFFRIISNLKISLLINLSRLITNIMLFLFLSTFSYLSKFNSNLVYSAHEVGLNVLSLVNLNILPRGNLTLQLCRFELRTLEHSKIKIF